jgi:glycosyltransferase involved in cell wall biosynthesis
LAKIAYFHNECAPYRMEVFRGLAKLPNVDLKVYFGRYRSSNRKWYVTLNFGFDHEILGEINTLRGLFSFDIKEDPNPINLTLPFKLLRGQFDLFMGGAPHYFGTVMTFLVSRICRKPFILFLEDVDFEGDEVSSYLARFKKNPFQAIKIPLIFVRFIFSQLVLKSSSSYVVPGTATKEYLLRRGVSSSKIFTAVNAVDNDRIDKECDRSLRKGNVEKLKSLLGVQNRKVILSVAYLLEKKGLQYLIQACGQLNKKRNDISLVIVGDGEYKENLLRLSAQNGIETNFVGYVPDLATFPDLVSYYLSADIFIMPTLRDVWGLVINEAMVCGCPIITTHDAKASKDLVKDGINGYIVEARNVGQLRSSIEKILDNVALEQKMKKASKKIIRAFSYENNAKGYNAAINYALKQNYKKQNNCRFEFKSIRKLRH